MRPRRPIALALILLGVAGQRSMTAQSGLDGIAGIAGFLGSLRDSDAYVGSVHVSLWRLGDVRPRLQFQGFSLNAPAGDGWYLASSEEAPADVVQTAWFVRDPHRFSVWAKKNRIPSRPRSLIARLHFYGRADTRDLAARVKTFKSVEWNAEGARTLSLETRPVRVGEIECAEYDARIIDRRAPPGFDEQPFLVTLSGRVCPHPDAPWLVVDIGHVRRTTEAEPAPGPDAADAAFVSSLVLEPFHGLIVEEMLSLDVADRQRAQDRSFWIDGTTLAGGTLWMLHTPDTLARIDLASNRVVAQVPIKADGIGAAGKSVWVSGPREASRVDSETNTVAQPVALTCPSGMVPTWRPLHAGDFGVWVACGSPDQGKRSSDLPGALRRLDPDTGATVADVRLPTTVEMMQGDAHHAWAVRGVGGKGCRLHEIDVDANRLIRTLAIESGVCRHVAIVGNEAWMLRGIKDRVDVLKVDLTTGTIMTTIPLAKHRFALDLAVGGDAVWVSTTTSAFEMPRGEFGSVGGLDIIDRSSGRLRGAMIPTGAADRLIGVQEDTAWLCSSAGAIVRVRALR